MLIYLSNIIYTQIIIYYIIYIVLGYSAFSFDDQHLLDIANNFGCFIVGSDDLSPADSVFYKARDVTATVDNAGLIIGK